MKKNAKALIVVKNIQKAVADQLNVATHPRLVKKAEKDKTLRSLRILSTILIAEKLETLEQVLSS